MQTVFVVSVCRKCSPLTVLQFPGHSHIPLSILSPEDEVEVENGKNNNNETEGHKQIRISERIKKRIVEINPDDIGENDNENDEDYK